MMGGRVGITDNVTIGEGALIAAGSGVMSDIPAGEKWGGAPAEPATRMAQERSDAARLARRAPATAKPTAGATNERHDASRPPASRKSSKLLPHRYPFLMVDRVIVDATAMSSRSASRMSPSTSRNSWGTFPASRCFPAC